MKRSFGRAMAQHLGQGVGIVWTSVRYVASDSPGPAIQNIVKQSRDKGRPVEIAGMLLDVSYGDGNKEETAKAYGDGLIRSRRNGPTRSWRELADRLDASHPTAVERFAFGDGSPGMTGPRLPSISVD